MPEENPFRRSSSAIALSDHDFDNDYQVPELDPPNPEAIAAECRRVRRRSVILAISSVILMATIGVITFSGVFAGIPSDNASAPEPVVSLRGFNASRLQKFCSHAEFEIACQMAVVEHVAETGATNEADDPHKILLVLVGAAMEIFAGGGLGGRLGLAVGDCRELLHFSVLELEGRQSDIQATGLLELPVKAAELMSAFSAAVTYPSTRKVGIAAADNAAVESWTEMMAATAGRASEDARNYLTMTAWMAGEGRIGEERGGGWVGWRRGSGRWRWRKGGWRGGRHVRRRTWWWPRTGAGIARALGRV